MSKVSRVQFLALLNKMGEDSSLRAQLLSAAEQAARALSIKLDREDMAEFQGEVIHQFGRLATPKVPGNPRFAMNLLGLGDVDRLMELDKTACSSTKGSAARSQQLPPWGQMDDHQSQLFEQWQIPKDWEPGNGSKPDCAQWRAWIGDVVVEIATTIWPVYEPTGVNWGTQAVKDLLEADFQLLSELHPYLGRSITGASSTTEHAVFFAEEDAGSPSIGTRYERYDDTLTSDLGRLPGIIEDGHVWKVGTLHLQLKQIFQRPRAHQVAWIQGRTTFKHLAAVSANTPSLVSGHCLQGSIAGCHALIELELMANDHSRKILQQFTVDIGDRRVFAGVHYPSDNLASWLTALNLVPYVFERSVVPSVKMFLWEAITQKSAVYLAIEKHARSRSGSPYRPALDALHKLRP